MTTTLGLACGEVPWEPRLLAALAARDDIDVRRRYVDLAAVTRDEARPDAVVLSPAVRGFEEKPLRQLLASGVRLIVLRDGIRPPWLDLVSCDVRELADVDFLALAAEVGAHTGAAHSAGRTGEVTVFLGASGGIGVTTMAWLYARQDPLRLLIDVDTASPSVAMLANRPRSDSTLTDAVRDLARGSQVVADDRVLTLAPALAADLTAADVADLLSALRDTASELVVDAGAWRDDPRLDAVLFAATRLALVTAATPLGLARLTAPGLVDLALPCVVIVNGLRSSIAGSSRLRSAVRRFVQEEFGWEPVLLADDTPACDAGWLHGDFGSVGEPLRSLAFSAR